ncbi:hypothetical protein OPV22_001274 [Ensete ventricosum]|uniref:phosphogluconate dehydrogenase (NADP(+)-dependent, decarboxylating) n=1 Tax=Ensete ventricosum TaxID=4639 RepID=A0AAV8RR14_ENSVE|nr:hypothetical protein OPV22_001274 [Ensete ventricosum]
MTSFSKWLPRFQIVACVTYVGKGGSGNFVKMVHDGFEYRGMQLLAKAYDVSKSVSKISNDELQLVFSKWNKGGQLSFLVEIAADIFGIKDDKYEGFLSGLKEERVQAAGVFQSGGFSDILGDQHIDKAKLTEDVRRALYASKICSYTQGMDLIRTKSIEMRWELTLGELAMIRKGVSVICAIFLVRIKKAYIRNPELANLLIDPEFAKEILD